MKNYFVENFWSASSTKSYGVRIAQACFDFIQNRCTSEDLRTSHKKDITIFSSNVESILDSATFDMTSE